MFKKLRQLAQKNKVPIISKATEAFLKDLLQKHSPDSILEIGSATWYSSLLIADSLKNQRSDWLVYSFEISHLSFYLFLSNLRTYPFLLPYIKPFNFDFLRYPLKFLPEFDFVFIDAQKSLYHKFLLRALKRVKKPGHIVIDDILKFGTKTQNLYSYLQKLWLTYQIIPMEKGDWLIYIKF